MDHVVPVVAAAAAPAAPAEAKALAVAAAGVGGSSVVVASVVGAPVIGRTVEDVEKDLKRVTREQEQARSDNEDLRNQLSEAVEQRRQEIEKAAEARRARRARKAEEVLEQRQRLELELQTLIKKEERCLEGVISTKKTLKEKRESSAAGDTMEIEVAEFRLRCAEEDFKAAEELRSLLMAKLQRVEREALNLQEDDKSREEEKKKEEEEEEEEKKKEKEEEERKGKEEEWPVLGIWNKRIQRLCSEISVNDATILELIKISRRLQRELDMLCATTAGE